MNDRQAHGLSNHFLISTPKLSEGTFKQSIIFICEHNKSGTMGLKINHTLPIKYNALFKQLNLNNTSETLRNTYLLDGGPVNTQQGFVLHSSSQTEWENTLHVDGNLNVTTSKDILIAIANGEFQGQFLITLGYSGWSPGQLEDELKDNAWMTIPATSHTLFSTEKTTIWQNCVDQLGFDFSQLSSVTGNA